MLYHSLSIVKLYELGNVIVIGKCIEISPLRVNVRLIVIKKTRIGKAIAETQ